jgi:TM2 domain-containing membrane protein YozV
VSISVFILVASFNSVFCSTGNIETIDFYTVSEQLQFFGKNKWITAFLAFLGGALGLHRFYMGHYKAGFFYLFCFLFIVPAFQLLFRGVGVFPVLLAGLLLGYAGLEVIGELKQAKPYLKPLQSMLLGLAFIPLAISVVWIGLILAFAGRSVYLALFISAFTLFSLFLSFRYATSSKREFIERFYKNRSIWH